MKIEWVPKSWQWRRWQTKLDCAVANTGTPCSSCHSPTSNRSAPLDMKCSATSRLPSPSTLTQKVSAHASGPCSEAERLTHTSNEGGSKLSELTAVARI